VFAHLPPLCPQQRIERPLTVSEYYHAAIGRHPRSHVASHDVVFVLEGSGEPDPQHWQQAIAQAAAANPGACLRLSGKRQHARWYSDAPAPALRVIENCPWDVRGNEGSEALFAQPLSLEEGRSAEVILVRGMPKTHRAHHTHPAPLTKVIFRVSHATMDGVGTLHFMQEVFRALRGEPLLGSNASFTDTDLLRQAPSSEIVIEKNISIARMMGATQGETRGGYWRRLSLDGPQPHLLPRLLAIMASYVRQHGERDKVARIGVPANLRRQIEGLLTTSNFTGMMYVDLPPTAPLDIDTIKTHLQELHDAHADMRYRKVYELMRYLPFAWVDGMLSINEKNYRNPVLHETAILTLLGSFKKSLFSGGGFAAQTLSCLPQLENVFVSVCGLQGNYEIIVGMPHVFASGGRMENLLDFIQSKLRHPVP
jgi:hypothetical protein